MLLEVPLISLLSRSDHLIYASGGAKEAGGGGGSNGEGLTDTLCGQRVFFRIFRGSRSYPQDCEHRKRKASSLFTMPFTLVGIVKCR